MNNYESKSHGAHVYEMIVFKFRKETDKYVIYGICIYCR
jgi:hypothetical protein